MNLWLRNLIIFLDGLAGGFVGLLLPMGFLGLVLWPGIGAIVGAFGAVIMAEAVGRHLDKTNKLDYVHETTNPLTFIVRIIVWLFMSVVLALIILTPWLSRSGR